MECIIESKCPKCGREQKQILTEDDLNRPQLTQFRVERDVDVLCDCGERFKTRTKVEE